MKEKKCYSCQEVKEIALFARHKNEIGGYKNQCKECCGLQRKEYYKKNKEKERLKHQNWIKNNPDKYRLSNQNGNQTKRKKKKEFIKEYLGGKCKKCGYSECSAALDCHHLNPKEKSFTIGHIRDWPTDLLQTELDKCVLLCCRCHRELHAGLWDISLLENNQPQAPKGT